ncbi:MAG: LOG family protein [Phycisphaerales bacterium]|nr:LOG family protein [Phycisphaerales bacterium]
MNGEDDILKASDPEVLEQAEALIRAVGGDPGSFEGRLVREMVTTALRFTVDKTDTGHLKLTNTALKELRYAFKVFSDYEHIHKISIFGSARTPDDHPDYIAAVEFARRVAEQGWMVITGAGDGIMKAGHEGPGRESLFGVAIRLPFETTANKFIVGDEKLIRFRYFFTRKLIFISQSEAVALFPGGFGTQDEGFEALTLVQTGKGAMVPIVMLEGEGGDYWNHWDNYVRHSLLEYGKVCEEDLRLYYIANGVDDAIDHVLRFYSVYHSSRYVKDDLVIRLNHRLTDQQVDLLNTNYSSLVKAGSIVQRGAFDEEQRFRDLPRLVFHHKKGGYGLLRMMIDTINTFDAEA